MFCCLLTCYGISGLSNPFAKLRHKLKPLEYSLCLARQYLHNETRNYNRSRYCFLQSVCHGNDGARGYRSGPA
jgi:hypothetical protein